MVRALAMSGGSCLSTIPTLPTVGIAIAGV